MSVSRFHQWSTLSESISLEWSQMTSEVVRDAILNISEIVKIIESVTWPEPFPPLNGLNFRFDNAVRREMHVRLVENSAYGNLTVGYFIKCEIQGQNHRNVFSFGLGN